jgi:Tfp pilus assembly protein FimT
MARGRKEDSMLHRADTVNGRQARTSAASASRGFSTIELVVALVVFLIVAALVVPNTLTMLNTFRVSSCVRSVAGQLQLAKMRAAADFTQTQVNCNLAGRSCQLQVCTTKGAVTCTTFTNDTKDGALYNLPANVVFGFGGAPGPAGTQAPIQNTAQIVFNSRGIPIDNTGAPTGNYGLYMTDNAGHTYGVTIYPTGKIAAWRLVNGAWRVL